MFGRREWFPYGRGRKNYALIINFLKIILATRGKFGSIGVFTPFNHVRIFPMLPVSGHQSCCEAEVSGSVRAAVHDCVHWTVASADGEDQWEVRDVHDPAVHPVVGGLCDAPAAGMDIPIPTPAGLLLFWADAGPGSAALGGDIFGCALLDIFARDAAGD